jgi:hypothetical protein
MSANRGDDYSTAVTLHEIIWTVKVVITVIGTGGNLRLNLNNKTLLRSVSA